MRVHYIQHVSFEGLGYIETWLKENGHSISSTKTWENTDFPQLEDFDALIILGGPMGVYDEHLYKWLKNEKGFIFDAIEAGKKIIGICLGAQLVASVLGATVCTNKHKEIGWFPVDIDSSFADWLQADVPSNMTVFHWHGDKFEIPYGGINHAFSKACNHQIFTYEQNIIGIQFHLEATTKSVQQMIENGSDELVNDKYIQGKTELPGTSEYYKESNRLMAVILGKLITGEGHRLSIEKVIAAQQYISDVFKNTPQFLSSSLSDLLNLKLVIKNETLNPVGSFKGRGSEVFVHYSRPGEHFFCASAGNFGQAMAYSCAKRKLQLTVYASCNANPYKVAQMRKMGAEVILFGEDFDAAKLEAKRRAKEFNGRFIEDSLDIESLEGAATIGLELLEFPANIDIVLIALGNGALLNGVARIIKHYKPLTKIVAVQAKGAPAMVDSWRNGSITNYPSSNTIADGIAVRIPIPQAIDDMKGLVDDAILVDDNSIIRGMQLLYKNTGIIVEPSGAVGIAAILENRSLFQNKTVATIICGSNVTDEQKIKWFIS